MPGFVGTRRALLGKTKLDYLAQWIGAATYTDWSAKPPSQIFTDTTEATPAVTNADKVGSWRSSVGGYTALQATAAQRLNLLIAGSRYTLTADGTDDNLVTSWSPVAEGNTIFFDLDVPATLSAVQIAFGFALNGSSRLFIGVDTAGRLTGGVGNQFGTILGAEDFRGRRCVGALTQDGATIKMFTLVGGEVHSSAQGGTVPVGQATRLGAVGVAGSASNWFGGGIARLIVAQKGGLFLSDWQNIGPQLAGAGA